MAFSFATGTAGEPVKIEFADGVHEIPAPYAAFMGGAEKLTGAAEDLKEVQYADFERGVLDEMQAASLSRLGKVAQLRQMKQRRFQRW